MKHAAKAWLLASYNLAEHWGNGPRGTSAHASRGRQSRKRPAPGVQRPGELVCVAPKIPLPEEASKALPVEWDMKPLALLRAFGLLLFGTVIFLLTVVLFTGCTQVACDSALLDENGECMTLVHADRLHHPETAPVVYDPHKGVPAVSVVEPRSGSWTGNNQLGIEQKFKPDAQNRQTILKMDENGPPVMWNVCLGFVNTLSAFNQIDATATIEFGVGGVTQIVKVDWLNGTCLSVPANAINVIAEFRNVDAVTEGPGLKLRASVSKYPRAGSLRPVCTVVQQLDLNGIGQEFIADIPAFASKIQFGPGNRATAAAFPPASANANTVILSTEADKPAGGNTILAMRLSENANYVGLPVTGGARSVKLTNTSGVAGRFSIWAEISL